MPRGVRSKRQVAGSLREWIFCKLEGADYMENTNTGSLALDPLSREWARKYEFAGIWESNLDDAFSDLAPYYDFASNLASLGLCGRWREQFISSIALRPGDKVLDVCAGTNAVGMGLLRRQPDLHVCAIDRSKAMQGVGQGRARARGLKIKSVIGDANHLPFPDGHFDVVTLQWATRHLRVVDAFSEIRRVLKPGGCFYHCDMLRPESRVVQTLYSAYLKACLPVTGLAFGSGPDTWSLRDYFVRCVEMFYSAREITQLLRHIGFSGVSSRAEVGGIVARHKAVKA